MSSKIIKRTLVLFIVLMAGCSDDPYDPLMGPRNPRPRAERFFDGRSDIPEDQKAALLDRRPCTPDFLAKMAMVQSREARSLVAANPSITPAIIEMLINDKEPGVRGYLAGNPSVPRPALLRLREDSSESVRWILPINPNWTEDDIRKMFAENTATWSTIARNSSAPPDVLEKLSSSTNYNILIGLANNPDIPQSVAIILAQQKESSIRKMMTYNPATPLEVLEALAKDPDPDVRSYASLSLQRRRPSAH
jgi:uncharacterized protein (DUF2336 family)